MESEQDEGYIHRRFEVASKEKDQSHQEDMRRVSGLLGHLEQVVVATKADDATQMMQLRKRKGEEKDADGETSERGGGGRKRGGS